MHPVILDNATDDIFAKRHKAMLRRYLDDYLDLAETGSREQNIGLCANVRNGWKADLSG